MDIAKQMELPKSTRFSWVPGSGRLGVLIAVIVALAIAPMFLSSYALRLGALIFMYVALAQSWNLIGGYAGLMSLAMPAFFGTGAVVAGVLVSSGVSPVLALGGGVLVALLIALIIAVPTLRLQGHYFVVATLLVAEAMRHGVLNINAFGYAGNTALNIYNFVGLSELEPAQYNEFFYFAMLVLAALSMLIVLVLERSKWGVALQSVRDNERAARALGIATARQKLYVFLLSAALAGVTGGMWAYWLGIVDTNEAFGFTIAFEVIVMVFLGGRGTLWGPVLGVCFVLAVNEWLGAGFPEIQMVILGVLVVLAVLFQPDGLVRLKGGLKAFTPSQLLSNLRRYKVE